MIHFPIMMTPWFLNKKIYAGYEDNRLTAQCAVLLLTTHGTNERIPVAVMADGVAFFKRYIRKVSEK